MHIVTTAGDGRRAVYEAAIMDEIDPPGVVFEPAEEHGYDTEHPVAECPKDIGETLTERDVFDTFEPDGDSNDSDGVGGVTDGDGDDSGVSAFGIGDDNENDDGGAGDGTDEGDEGDVAAEDDSDNDNEDE